MTKVVLSDTEKRLCGYIGKLRNSITSQNSPDMIQDKSLDTIQISIDGVMSEYATAKFLNLHFDLNCDYRKFGPDLISKRGAAIDVKSTNKRGGNLNAVGWADEKPADIYILTEIHEDGVEVVGWISREEFLKPENRKDVGNGPFYSIPQSALTPFKDVQK